MSANPNLLASSGLPQQDYAATLLVDENENPLTSESFGLSGYFIFHYPYISTPCFLIKLDHPTVKSKRLKTANNDAYQWLGGVGPQQNIVAFAAICTHKLSYMSRSASFINFRPEEITYINNQELAVKQQQLIYCCSERSVYEPAKGAKVLGGPASQPLTTIAPDVRVVAHILIHKGRRRNTHAEI